MTVHKFGHHISSPSLPKEEHYYFFNITLTGSSSSHSISYALNNLKKYYIFPIESGIIYSINISPSNATLRVNNRIYDSTKWKGINLKKGDRLQFPASTSTALYAEIIVKCPVILNEN